MKRTAKPASLFRRDFLRTAASAAIGVPVLARGFPLPATKPVADVDYSHAISDIKQMLTGAMAKNQVKSAAIALVDGQRTVWAEGFGFIDTAGKLPVTADSIFSLQSISKTYTATAFLIALSKGWLKLDDPLRKHLRGFTVNSRFGPDQPAKITFRHLLSHWAGLPHEAPLGNNYDDRPCTFEEHVQSIYSSWMRFPVGKTYCYSNLGIDLAGYVLQLLSRRPFDEFMRQELFAPLGMKASTFDHGQAVNSASFVGGDVGHDELLRTPIPMVAAGGMYSSVRDMARFISFHLSDGQVTGKRLIPTRLLQEMYTPQFPVKFQAAGYGLGIFAKPYAGATLLWHGGGGYGYNTMQHWILRYQVGVAVLTNDGNGSSLADDVVDLALKRLLETKYGTVPAQAPIKLTDRPVMPVEEKQLRRLEGTYKAYSGLLSMKVENGELKMIRGGGSRRLTAHGAAEFTADLGTPNAEKFTFTYGRNGKPTFVHDLGDNGTDFFMPNDAPDDPPGPNRPEWSKFTGAYQARSYGDDVPATILIKNGYLYTGRGLKLGEYRSGFFFTPDGDAVIFTNDGMLYGNRPYVKA